MPIECKSPVKLLRPSCMGPILAMPMALGERLDLLGSDLAGALGAAARALSRFQVVGKLLPPREAVMVELDQAIAVIGARAAARPAVLVDDKKGRFATYDRAFSVSRTNDAPAGLVHGLLVGTKALLVQLGHSNGLTLGAHKELVAGLATAIAGLSAEAAVLPSFEKLYDATSLPPADPMGRWVDGHHALFAMCQVAEYHFYRLKGAEKVGDFETARNSLAAAASAFNFIGYAFALAGDVSEPDYRVIVDHMLAVDPNFSGLWFADHREAKDLARGLLKGCPLRLGTSNLASFALAFHFASSSHTFVCGEMDGSDRSSLLMGGELSGVSGVESLRQFAQVGLKGIGAKVE